MSSIPYNLELDAVEDIRDLPDWRLLRCFNEDRHMEDVTRLSFMPSGWRMKERMKTVSVALVLCLNVGVDPPDILKTQPCAKQECWLDPTTMAPQKSLETIGANLQKQYERWQPRARYKQSLDPTVEEIKKLCTSLRRNSKDERVLFHYNGHGVPRPTINGEIWVFNRSYTQYIPLSLYDLQKWVGAPSIYVYDCSGAGIIVDSFNQFAVQHEKEYELSLSLNPSSKLPSDGSDMSSPPQFKNCIQLAACSSDQILPMNPDLPADLFTSCLTTPIKIALQWFIKQNSGKLLSSITLELLDKIPGQLTDRRTMLGELNWIFTAITDTIAWNVLPRELFQRLFRQDLLVASLFRNFLLADRIMRSYNCTPVSSPRLPATNHHPLWLAWDLAVDNCLSQLPGLLQDNNHVAYCPSNFFSEQLTAFQVWLSHGARRSSHPEQLPIVLQVLLSQVHRLRALDLLGRFLDIGPWAVHLALSVGIFPYVLKLLQSSARELRPLLVFIWTKIMAFDQGCQVDLVRDNGHKYFLNILSDLSIHSHHRTMAAFIMALIVRNYPHGQEAALQGSLIAHCLEQLNDQNALLRQWLAVSLGLTWSNYESARWCGVRDSAHEKLFLLLNDPVPEVRAAAVFALGTFINSAQDRTDHANTIDHSIGITLINNSLNDGSILVRKELAVALHWLILLFENQFIAAAMQTLEEEKFRDGSKLSPFPANQELTLPAGTPPYSGFGVRRIPSTNRLLKPQMNSPLNQGMFTNEALTPPNSFAPMKRVGSTTSLTNIVSTAFPAGGHKIGNVYYNIWRAMNCLADDPHPMVAHISQMVVEEVTRKIPNASAFSNDSIRSDPSSSEPSSPPNFVISDSPPANATQTLPRVSSITPTFPYPPKRTIFGRQPSPFSIPEDGSGDESSSSPRSALISTEFVGWLSKHFSQPMITSCDRDVSDTENNAHQEREWRTIRNFQLRQAANDDLLRLDPYRIDEQIFSQKSQHLPSSILFHPYECDMIVAEQESFSLWNLGYNNSAPTFHGSYGNLNAPPTRISSMKLVNAHDVTLLMIASDDGSVRVWKIHGMGSDESRTQPVLVSAFQLFRELQSNQKSYGLILHWDQESGTLVGGGDAKLIRIWDSQTEMRTRDILTGSDASVSSIHGDGAHLICAGCQDGTIRLFDRRLSNTECRVITFREHGQPVLNAHMYADQQKHVSVLSASVAGDVRFWDKRLLSSIKTIQVANGMTALAAHSEADIIACATTCQSINVYSLDGIPGSVIRNNEGGFMSQKLSPINCLSFHPLKLYLGVGTADSYISVFSSLKSS